MLDKEHMSRTAPNCPSVESTCPEDSSIGVQAIFEGKLKDYNLKIAQSWTLVTKVIEY